MYIKVPERDRDGERERERDEEKKRHRKLKGAKEDLHRVWEELLEYFQLKFFWSSLNLLFQPSLSYPTPHKIHSFI
jgi:hypothetical protein